MLLSHVSDDELLDLKHGPPSAWLRVRLRAHLMGCSRCRVRRAGLEALHQRWLNRQSEDLDISPLRIAEARERFLSRVTHAPSRLGFARLALAAASACIAVAAGVGVWKEVRKPPPSSLAKPKPALAKPKVTVAPAIRSTPTRIIPSKTHVEPPAAPPPTTASTEVAILWILHEKKICQRGSVELTRTPSGGLLLHGVLESAEEKTELESQATVASNGEPLRLDLHVPGDAAPAASAETAPTIITFRQAPPGQEMIRAFVTTSDPEINRISNAVVQLAGSLSAQSWALRRLDARFSPQDLAALPPLSRDRFNQMRADHLILLTTQLHELQTLLAPVIGTETALPGQSVASEGLQDVSNFAALLEDYFAGSTPHPAPTIEARLNLQNLLAKSQAAIHGAAIHSRF
jgi:hypothetical protein